MPIVLIWANQLTPDERNPIDIRKRVWFWVILFFLAWFSTCGSAYGHYYIVVIPSWGLLCGLALATLTKAASKKSGWPERWLNLILIAGVVLLLCLPDLPSLRLSKQGFVAERLSGDNPFAESLLAANRVRKLTSEKDYVFVAGSEPQILYYANRRSPTRFVITYPLMLPTVLASKYQRETISALELQPPAVIVFVASNLSWLRQPGSPPEFLEYVEKIIQDDYEPLGGYVKTGEASASQWIEPWGAERVGNATLVVYQRKK